jgi:UDP:flavonoid glycosyltransferase YjiC (YdhE family)
MSKAIRKIVYCENCLWKRIVMKILVQPYTHTLSHISRPLAIALELRKKGHDIIFTGESNKARLITEEGFPIIPCYEPDPNVLFANIRAGKLQFVDNTVVEKMIEADVQLYRDQKPDLVLTDGRFSSQISTHIAGIPHIAIVNVSSTEFRAHPYIPFFEWIPEKLVGQNTRQRQRLDQINLYLEMRIFDNVMSIFKKLTKRYGLSKNITATNCLTGKDFTLLADIPEYFPTRNLPGDYRYIGPITWKTTSIPPSWWPPKLENKHCIYMTMGTTGIGRFFHELYELFQQCDFVTIITTGGLVEGLEQIEGKIYVEDYLDGDMVMEACDLVVCHGGNGTIYQALRHGKPIIGIPTIPDQKFNMRRVETLGVGRTLTIEEFDRNNQSLLNLINLILADSSYGKEAERLSDTLKGYANAPQRACNILENFMD